MGVVATDVEATVTFEGAVDNFTTTTTSTTTTTTAACSWTDALGRTCDDPDLRGFTCEFLESDPFYYDCGGCDCACSWQDVNGFNCEAFAGYTCDQLESAPYYYNCSGCNCTDPAPTTTTTTQRAHSAQNTTAPTLSTLPSTHAPTAANALFQGTRAQPMRRRLATEQPTT